MRIIEGYLTSENEKTAERKCKNDLIIFSASENRGRLLIYWKRNIIFRSVFGSFPSFCFIV